MKLSLSETEFSCTHYLANKDKLDIYYTNFTDSGTGEQFKPNPKKTFDKELFTENELQILESVAERFKTTSTNAQAVINLYSSRAYGWIKKWFSLDLSRIEDVVESLNLMNQTQQPLSAISWKRF